MASVFVVNFSVVKPNAPGVAGPAYQFRGPERTVLVVADEPGQIGEVITKNVDPKPGELVEITSHRQLEAGRKVFA